MIRRTGEGILFAAEHNNKPELANPEVKFAIAIEELVERIDQFDGIYGAGGMGQQQIGLGAPADAGRVDAREEVWI